MVLKSQQIKVALEHSCKQSNQQDLAGVRSTGSYLFSEGSSFHWDIHVVGCEPWSETSANFGLISSGFLCTTGDQQPNASTIDLKPPRNDNRGIHVCLEMSLAKDVFPVLKLTQNLEIIKDQTWHKQYEHNEHIPAARRTPEHWNPVKTKSWSVELFEGGCSSKSNTLINIVQQWLTFWSVLERELTTPSRDKIQKWDWKAIAATFKGKNLKKIIKEQMPLDAMLLYSFVVLVRESRPWIGSLLCIFGSRWTNEHIWVSHTTISWYEGKASDIEEQRASKRKEKTYPSRTCSTCSQSDSSCYTTSHEGLNVLTDDRMASASKILKHAFEINGNAVSKKMRISPPKHPWSDTQMNCWVQ